MSKILITSAIPNVAGVKHLGNLVGSLLPADVHARFRRQLGDDVLFICGTDDHGTPSELGALRAGRDVAAYCDEQHAIQRDIYRRFGLSFDHFGRSSEPHNHRLTQHLYRRLDDAGLIEERTTRQIWSPADKRFLPDRYVVGTCPLCSFSAARGDQCDSCGELLDAPDLIDARSALSGDDRLQVRESRQIFLRQSRLLGRLTAWLESRRGWPGFVAALARSWLTDELRDRCISRDLAWGIPVPRPGFDGKVFYVWFDAPIAYIAITQAWAENAPGRDWRDWWWQADDVRYLQFLGKDNIPFHSVTFPATLLGAGEPWKTVDVIKGFHWLSYEGAKFSTSRNQGIFTDAALEELPADYWRWWLIAHAPETADTDFRLQAFAEDVNKDLADIFGNLVNRIVRFAHNRYGGRIPAAGRPGAREAALSAELTRALAALGASHEALKFRQAAAETRRIWSLANRYVQESAPWAAIDADADRAAVATRTSLNLVRLAALVSWSVIPSLAEQVLTVFAEKTGADIPAWPKEPLPDFFDQGGGKAIKDIGPLVNKISDTRLSALKKRFGDGH